VGSKDAVAVGTQGHIGDNGSLGAILGRRPQFGFDRRSAGRHPQEQGLQHRRHDAKFDEGCAMRTLLLCSFVLVASCTQEGDYKTNRIDLGLNFVAKMMCGCVWVSKLDERHCRDLANVDQVNPDIQVDASAKTVDVTWLWVFKAKSQF